MLTEGQVLTKNVSTDHFLWEEFDFSLCNNFPGRKYTWAIFTLFCFILGFPASAAILWELFKMHRSGVHFTPNRFFILHVSIMDAVFLLFIPAGVLNHLIWESWPMEAFWNGVYALNTWGRPLLMVCSCVDCYFAVVHPVTYHNMKSMTPRIWVVVIVWISTLIAATISFMFYKLYFTLWAIVPFMIAITVVGICDFFIFYTLVTSGLHRNNLQKQRAIQTLFNSLVITILTYLPPVILTLIGVYGIEYVAFACVIAIPMTIMSSLGSVLMPILHLITTGKFNYFRCGNFLQNVEK